MLSFETNDTTEVGIISDQKYNLFMFSKWDINHKTLSNYNEIAENKYNTEHPHTTDVKGVYVLKARAYPFKFDNGNEIKNLKQ